MGGIPKIHNQLEIFIVRITGNCYTHIGLGIY
jgi:hypothetical protein